MLSLNIYNKIPITHMNNNTYTGIEKVKNKFYFCDPCQYQIVEYNHCFEQINCYQVKRGYTQITYCELQKCFYAITKDDYNTIYQLNLKFEEINCYSIETECYAVFNGIDCCGEELYLSCQCYIFIVSLACKQTCHIFLEEDCLSCVARCPRYLLTTSPSCRGSTFLAYDKCKCLKLACCLPSQYYIEDIICDQCYIYILVTNCKCYQFVLVCQIDNHCHEEHKHQECNDIIESIALMETSLSHILNAEGEKLQKIIACSDDPEIILEVNKAVNKTITNVTHLEHVLYSKLEIAKCLCEKNKKEKN